MAAPKRQKTGQLRELKTDELEQRLTVLVDERFRLAFKRGTEAVPNPLQFRTMRREIARIKTILRERERKGAEA